MSNLIYQRAMYSNTQDDLLSTVSPAYKWKFSYHVIYSVAVADTILYILIVSNPIYYVRNSNMQI